MLENPAWIYLSSTYFLEVFLSLLKEDALAKMHVRWVILTIEDLIRRLKSSTQLSQGIPQPVDKG